MIDVLQPIVQFSALRSFPTLLADVTPVLFPIGEAWWIYAAFVAFVITMLALDLGVFHKTAHVVSFKEAAAWSVVWVTLALLFNLGFWYYAGWIFPQMDPALIAAAGFESAQQAANALSLQFLTNIIFAVDSVPAIFALTNEPLIVFTSNIFAILGLRSLYFLLAGAYDKFHLLKIGLGIVLVFVGLKMAWLNEAMGGKFPVSWSLSIICGVVGASMVLSLAFPKKASHASKPN